MPTSDLLFEPQTVGDLSLKNRVVMAPMTRSRSQQPGNIPTALMAEYYRQRAGAGLIISEGTQISPQGQGYLWTPGIHSDEQVAGWRLVTDAVHQSGGLIAAQLWHVGRVSHPAVNGLTPVGPSALPAEGAMVFLQDEQGPRLGAAAAPRALETSELPAIIADYRRAAQSAQAAGFDAVEIHAANGYLLDQFLRSGANTRSDSYGGSLDNRVRLLAEVTEACISVLGKGRVGVRLSPFLNINGLSDATPEQTFLTAIATLGDLGVAFVHLNEESMGDVRGTVSADFHQQLRRVYQGSLILCGGYTGDSARQALRSGTADAIGFGRPYMSNPDLAERLCSGQPLAAPAPREAYFGGGATGYTDFPTAA